MGAPKISRIIAWQIRQALMATNPDGTRKYTQVEVANMFDLHQSNISRIGSFKRWSLTSTESTSVPDKRFAQPTKCPQCQSPLVCETNGMGDVYCYCPNRHEYAA